MARKKNRQARTASLILSYRSKFALRHRRGGTASPSNLLEYQNSFLQHERVRLVSKHENGELVSRKIIDISAVPKVYCQ